MARKPATNARFSDWRAQMRQCPVCRAWIECIRGRMRLNHHIEEKHPEAWSSYYAPTWTTERPSQGSDLW